MKRKLRIFSNIAIIALSVCMFAFGVYAANQVSVTTSGTVTFNATDVYANVKLEVAHGSGDYSLLQQIDFNASTVTTEVLWDSEELSNLNIAFNEDVDDIKLKFTVLNKATDRNIDLTFIDNTGTSEIISKKIQSSTMNYKTDASGNSVYNVNPQVSGINNSEEIIITFSVENANVSGSLAYNFVIKLDNQTEINTSFVETETVKKYGNTFVCTADLATGKALNNYTINGTTDYQTLYPAKTDAGIVSGFHIFGTGLTTIAENISDIETNYSFSDASSDSNYLKIGCYGPFSSVNFVLPIAVNHSEAGYKIINEMEGSMYDSVTTIQLPVSMQKINGFQFNVNLKSIYLPAYVNYIYGGSYGMDAFNFSSLEQIIVDPFNTTFYGDEENTFVIERSTNQLILACGTDLVIPNYVESIRGRCVFVNGNTDGKYLLKTLSFESGSKITSLPDGMCDTFFQSLTSVTNIPASVKEIENYCFYGCMALKTITFEEGSQLEVIGDSAFNTCVELTTISLPSTLKSISGSAFGCCDKLATINFGGTKEQWDAIEFDDSSIYVTVTVNCADDNSFTIGAN